VRGLGKRKELDQEEEGFWVEVDVGEEEVEECLKKEGDREAAGENEMGRKVIKVVWRVEWCREVIMGIVKGILNLGYVVERWRRSVGIIMRKPNKRDYGLPSSYRVINLLDVLGKVVERMVARRLEKWGQEGMGDEQYGGRVGRSSLDGVGKLYKRWEEGGGNGALLCIDVMGGYENVEVGKCVKRLREVGVEEFLVKWVTGVFESEGGESEGWEKDWERSEDERRNGSGVAIEPYFVYINFGRGYGGGKEREGRRG